MKKLLLLLLIFPCQVFSQTSTKDSVKIIYNKYYQTRDSINTKHLLLETKYLLLENKYNNLNLLLIINNDELKRISNKDALTWKQRFEQRKKRILNTTDFISSANNSLNAIKQIKSTTTYLNTVNLLNNPINTDLGFSLSNKIEDLIQNKIIYNQNKINGVKSNKLLELANNIIEVPIIKSIPVVNSIESIINLITSVVLKGDQISIKQFQELKESLEVYVQHYDELAKAQYKFDQNLANLNIRKDGLSAMIQQYTIERISSLNPSITTDSLNKNSLNELLSQFYQREIVNQNIESIISLNPSDYQNHLINNKLFYPEYAISQAKLIYDEIISLGEEYMSIYKSYQKSIEDILNNSKSIGKPDDIEKKIKNLKKQLIEVEFSFNDNLNIPSLKSDFKTLVNY